MPYNVKPMVRLRKILRLNQKYMCTLLNLSSTTYSGRENMKTVFSVDEMESIRRIFSEKLGRELTIDELFFTERR